MSTNERLAKTTELNIKMQLIVAFLEEAVKLKVCLILLFFHCSYEGKSIFQNYLIVSTFLSAKLSSSYVSRKFPVNPGREKINLLEKDFEII